MNNKQVVDYYDQTEIDYRLIWHLSSEMAMHYGFWDRKVSNLKQALQRENQVLSFMAQIKKSDIVLDAGCGVGGSSIYLAKKIGCRVMGITLSQKQAETASANALRNKVDHLTDFQVMDFTDTKFKEASFDVVWAIESVCHAQNKAKFVKESFRLLKKGGRLILADGFADKSNYLGKEKEWMEKWLTGWGVDFLEVADNFKKYLTEAGFKKISFKDVTWRVMPSSKRLYKYFFPAFLITKIAQLFKLRNKIQTGNVISAYYQYKVLKKGLAEYGIFYAQK